MNFLKFNNIMNNKLKEVSLNEYLMWYQKLVLEKPNEITMEEFESEIKNWNLYDITYYYTDKNDFIKFIRVNGVPSPYLQSYLEKNFKSLYDFSVNGISNLKVIPYDSQYEVKLKDIRGNEDFHRRYQSQMMNLYEWGEMVF